LARRSRRPRVGHLDPASFQANRTAGRWSLGTEARSLARSCPPPGELSIPQPGLCAPPGDSQGLEALVRYMMRPPVSLSRLRFTPGWHEVVYARKGGHDEPELTEDERIDAMDFVARVLVQIPDPRRHSVRYYGFYAHDVTRGWGAHLSPGLCARWPPGRPDSTSGAHLGRSAGQRETPARSQKARSYPSRPGPRRWAYRAPQNASSGASWLRCPAAVTRACTRSTSLRDETLDPGCLRSARRAGDRTRATSACLGRRC